MKPLNPSWLDDYGLTPNAFRLYLHLCRRSGKDNVAYPAYESMQATCLLSRASVWRGINELVKRGLIERLGKRFGKESRYKVVVPIVSHVNDCEPPNSLPVKHQSFTCETSIVSHVNPKVSNEGIQKKESNNIGLFPETETKPPKPSNDDLMENLWKITPKLGRERSSKKNLEEAIRKIPKGKRPPNDEIISAFEAWKKSDLWTKDGGQYVQGVHRWVTDRQWENIPDPAPNGTNGHPPKQMDLAGRSGHEAETI